MPIEGEEVARHHSFVDGSSDEDIAKSHTYIGGRTLQSLEGRTTSSFGRLSDLHFVALGSAVEDIEYPVLCILCLMDDVPRGMLYIQVLFPEGSYMRRAVKDGGEELEDTFVFEGLQDDFIADTIDVTVGNCYSNLACTHCVAYRLESFCVLSLEDDGRIKGLCGTGAEGVKCSLHHAD